MGHIRLSHGVGQQRGARQGCRLTWERERGLTVGETVVVMQVGGVVIWVWDVGVFSWERERVYAIRKTGAVT